MKPKPGRFVPLETRDRLDDNTVRLSAWFQLRRRTPSTAVSAAVPAAFEFGGFRVVALPPCCHPAAWLISQRPDDPLQLVS